MKFTLLKCTTQCFRVSKHHPYLNFVKKNYWGVIDLQYFLVSGFIPQRNPIPISVAFQFCYTDLYVYLLPEQCCLNYWSSQVTQELWYSINFEIGNCASSNLILLFQDCLISLDLLQFDVNFRINLLIFCQKKINWDLKRDYIEFVRLVCWL